MEVLTSVYHWLLSSAYSIYVMVVGSWSWLGVSLIGIWVLDRVIRILRKVY